MKAAWLGMLVLTAISVHGCGNFPQTSLRAGNVQTGNACLDSLSGVCYQIYNPTTCQAGNLSADGANDCMAAYELRRKACESGMTAEQVAQLSITCQ